MKSLPIEPLEARYAPATLSIAPASIYEGDSGTTKLIFTVTLSAASDTAVTVDFATEDGTATVVDHDYEALTGTLTFEPNQTSKTIEVTINGDLTAEADEAFKLKLSNPSGAGVTLGTAEANGTIKNDGVHLVGQTSFLEGDSGTKNITYTVRRETLTPNQSQTVHFETANGTAQATSDYVATSGDLVFAAGEVEKTFQVTVNGDTASEGDETFKLKLTAGSGVVVSTPETTVTIKDDGGVHLVGPFSILEGDDTHAVTFTLRREGSAALLTEPLTVHYATADDTATVADNDYEATQGDLTFAAGETEKTFTITIKGDQKAEADEAFKILLTGGEGFTTTTPETVVALKNDGVHVVGPLSFLEGDSGTKSVTYVVRRETLTSDQPLTIEYSTVDGTAIAGSDYVAKSGTFEFAAGELEKTFDVVVNGDVTSEGNETLKIKLTGANGATSTEIPTPETTITIQDDGGVHFVGPVDIFEGDDAHAVTFTLRREGSAASLTQPLTVHYATADGTATVDDYEATSGDLTFAPGETQKTFTINIKGDLTAEADETFKILLSGGEGFNTSTPENVITIKNDGVHINSASTTEGDDGIKTLTFDIVRETADLGAATLKYTTVDGTATVSGRDYQKALGTVVFAQGETTKQISVNILGDLVGENDETFKVKLSDAVGTTITIDEATGTILNDAKLSISAGSTLEGDSGTKALGLNVTLVEGPASGTVTVKYKTEDLTTGTNRATAGDDYEAVTEPGSLTFNANEKTKTISIAIKGDTVGEADEVFNVRLLDPTGATLVTDVATATILNDAKFTFVNDAGAALTGPVSKSEGNSGTQNMVFKVKVTEADPTGATKVNYTPVSGTGSNAALATEDFVATPGTLEFTEEGQIKEIAVPIIGDTRFESDETFSVTLTSADRSHAAFPAGAVGTIVSDDELTISDVVITEGDSGVTKAIFTVTLKAAVPSDQKFLIDFNTVDVSAFGSATEGKLADYKTTTGTLTIAAGKTVGTIEVEVYGDLNREAAENLFQVALKNGRYVDANNSVVRALNFGPNNEQAPKGTGKIVDSGDALPTISISDVKLLEGTANDGSKKQAEFTLALSEAADFDITVDLSTLAGTAESGADFDGFANKIVTIPAGSKTFTVPVAIAQDSLDEADETFSLKINSAKLGTESLVVTRDTATGTILNDEVYVTVAPSEITPEGNPNSAPNFVVFKVQLRSSSTNAPVLATRDVTVNFSTEDLTAISSGELRDYIAAQNGQVVIKQGTSEAEIRIEIVGDTQDEGGKFTGDNANKEQFKLKLTSAQGARLGETGDAPLTVIGTIADDDSVPTVTLVNEMPGGAVTEGGQAVFKVKLSHKSDHDIVIPYTLENFGAIGGSASSTDPKDYINGTDLKITIPAGQLEATITVNTVDDALSEATGEGKESFKVKLGAISAVDAVAGNSEVTAKIADNDPLPTISIGNYVVVEGNSPGEKKAVFTVTLSSKSGQDVKVNYQTIDGLAVKDSDYEARSGTLTIAAGELTGTIEVPIIGDNVPEPDETFFVRLSQLENVDPTARIVIDQGVGTILADETQYGLEFKNGSVFSDTIEVTEENGSSEQKITLRIRRTGDTTQAGSVRLTTLDGNNAAGDLFRNATGSGERADFDFLDKVVTFAPGAEFSDEFTITLNSDNYYEGKEQFRVRLSEAVNGIVSEANSKMGTVTIIDNEEAPTISFEQTTVTLQEGGLTTNSSNQTVPQQSQMLFKIKLSHVDETGTVSMRFVTEDIDALSTGTKKDYEAVAKDITFAPGETEKTQAVVIYGDARDEYDDTFRVKLSQVGGGAAKFAGGVSELTATGKILDDDAEAVVSITDLSKPGTSSNTFVGASYTEVDGATDGKFFRVSLIGETDKVVTVKYSTVDGTAKAGSDFVGITDATLTFNPDDTSKVQKIFVPIINDTAVEGSENFSVTLKDVTNAQLGTASGVATITDDDNPIVSIDDIQVIEGDDPSAPVKAKFTVRLASPADREVVVNFATQDGTAKASGIFADYIARQGQITFAKGETEKQIEIDILGDLYREGYYVAQQGDVAAHIVDEEAFSVKLSGTGLTFAKDTGTGTIKNGNDTTIGVGVLDTQVVENTYRLANGVNQAVATTADFTVELSVPYVTQSPAFTAALRSGTAAKGSDFSDFGGSNPGSVTFAAGSTSAKFSVQITADSQFETTEHFFLNLSQLPTGVQAAKSEARGTIYSEDVRQLDARTIQWIDVDGDLVTLKINKGTLTGNNIAWRAIDSGTNEGAIYISPTGGRTLQLLNVNSTQYQKANITITAERQPGFTGDTNGILGDGRVNVGFISAGGYSSDGTFFGIDLGKVKVDGDLGRIEVGDAFVDGISLKKLDVYSIGMHPEEEGLITFDSQNQPQASIGSYIQGSVAAINVRTDVGGAIRVAAARFGDIGSLRIGGALVGNEFQTSGSISFTGTLRSAVVGAIVGGSGASSGRIDGDASYGANVGRIVVENGIFGGEGANSGVVAAARIGSTSTGYLVGGEGDDSGAIRAGSLGSIVVKQDVVGGDGDRSALLLGDSGLSRNGSASIGRVLIGGRIIGGAGANSGVVGSDGKFGSAIVRGEIAAEGALSPDVKGAVIGGDGTGSGRLHASGTFGRIQLTGQDGEDRLTLVGGNGAESGKITAGSVGSAVLNGTIQGGSANASGIINIGGGIKSLKIQGDLHGGDSPANATAVVNTTGAIIAGRIGSLNISGDVIAGEDNGVGLQGSGSVAVQGPLQNLHVGGSLLGNQDNSVNILVFGGAKEAAIGKLYVGGSAEFTNVNAGVSVRALSNGVYPVNADARINSIVIGGDVKGFTVTAGGNTGADGIFATADDQVMNNSSAEIDSPKVYSQIASVIIKGQIHAVTDPNTQAVSPYGIVAQHIGSIRYGTSVPGALIKVALKSGAGNDLADSSSDPTPGVDIEGGKGFRAIELPIA